MFRQISRSWRGVSKRTVFETDLQREHQGDEGRNTGPIPHAQNYPRNQFALEISAVVLTTGQPVHDGTGWPRCNPRLPWLSTQGPYALCRLTGRVASVPPA